jgi:hypothetical protein
LVQVDYVRVVDLDIGASKSDICAVRVATIRNAPAELEPARRLVHERYGKHLVYSSAGG